MPRYYITPYIGDGTDQNLYIPRASHYGPWSAIGFGNPGLAICRLEAPASDSQLYDLGDSLDKPLPSNIRRGIENRLGVTLGETAIRRILAELLMGWAGGISN